MNTELATKIQSNFDAMMSTLECIINPLNPIKSMTVTGASGIGKTYNLEKRLSEAHKKGDCNYFMLNSKCTAVGLYKALYEARHLGSIILLDDVDVFNNEDSLNILKASIDSSTTRVVTYQAASSELRKSGIPNQFTFKGKVVFITNSNLKAMSLANNALAPHIKAVMTRGVFIDLEIHDNESIMVHIENIIRNTDIITKSGLSKAQAEEILDFMIQNTDKLRNPSLRTPVQLSGICLGSPNDWKMIASKVLLND